MELKNLVRITALTLMILTLLYFGRVVFIPLSFALLLSFIAYPVCQWLQRKGAGPNLSIGLSLILFILPVSAIILLFIFQFSDIRREWGFISNKVNETLQTANLPFGLSGKDISVLTGSGPEYSPEVLSSVISSAGSLLIQFLIIPFYMALILYHRKRLVAFVLNLFPGLKPEEFRQLIKETVTTYYNFVKGMAVVYITVGILNSAGLLILGVPNAILYGFTASILTFIPYIGIIIGSVMPAALAWSLHDSVYAPLGVIGVFAVVQLLEANLIFPLAVSQKIKVNTLVTLIAIFAGGVLWGAAGMILFIPFLAILKLIADRHPEMQSIRILLGTDSKNK